MKASKKSSEKQRISDWIMKQNALLVVGAAALLLFLGYKSVTGFFYPSSENQENLPSPTSTARPVIQDSPPIKPVVIRATASPSPSPSPSTEPMVNCMYLSKCGGSKLTTSAECTKTTCCEIEQGSFQIVTQERCQQALDDRMKKYEEQLAKESANYQKELDEYLAQQKKYYESLANKTGTTPPSGNSSPTTSSYVPTYSSAELYKKCLSDAEQKAAAAMRATGNGDCFGEGCPTTQLENDKITCEILYGSNL